MWSRVKTMMGVKQHLAWCGDLDPAPGVFTWRVETLFVKRPDIPIETGASGEITIEFLKDIFINVKIGNQFNI